MNPAYFIFFYAWGQSSEPPLIGEGSLYPRIRRRRRQ
jgi:hypothetical protein